MTEAALLSGGQQWRRAAETGLSFRPAAADDLPFLLRVYSSTREDELSQVAWSSAQKADFLAMQFHAQHTYYRQHYAGALWLVILHGGAPIGRLYLERLDSAHCIIDIALLPEFRGKGLGGALMRDLIEEPPPPASR